MTHLFTQTPQFFGDICEEIRLFIDTRKVGQLAAADTGTAGFVVAHEFAETGSRICSTAKLFENGAALGSYTYECAAGQGSLERKRIAKRAAKISVYRAMSAHFGQQMPWGSLTGVRPVKLLRDSAARLGEAQARRLFLHEFDVSEAKTDLAQRILETQAALLPGNEKDVDLYVGIPFCTTRCAYCSFASSTPDVFAGAEQMYVDALLGELDAARPLLAGRTVRAVYVGGGTPTAISAGHLEAVLARAAAMGAGAAEFTVEAGRPDTISDEKLDIISGAGARRISVNAQTMNDETLRRIGRRHTSGEFAAAFERAAGRGFDVNVDVIAGLPGEGEADFEDTLRRIIDLAPQNITVHTLAVKRASAFAKENMGAFPASETAARMVERAHQMLAQAGYGPYYLYRQKYMKGSLENTGYQRNGTPCLYNIDNMEEMCDVMAFGAGAISKRIFGGENRIERAAGVKDLREYIARAGEMQQRRQRLFGDAPDAKRAKKS